MDQARKKKIKGIISLVCVFALVAVLAMMPLIAKQAPDADGPTASILSGTVSTGAIDVALMDGGTLAEEDGVSISVPAAVKLKAFLVSNGEQVTAGTPIATVDRVTVMTAITQVQETLEYLSDEIEAASKTDSETSVTALAGGTVKIIHAKTGDAVQAVMLEHGALAVLSLDGLMAVDLETESDLAVGTAVTVTFSNGDAIPGKITKNLAGKMTVTVEDQDYAVGEAVAVTDEDGTSIGSGELYIYSPWNLTAYAGTVKSIKVSVGDQLSAGKTMMVLGDVGYSATYRQLISQRQAYEELMLELFQMYQTETITAPCDGVVSGMDENSLQLLADQGQGYTLTLLANAPNGDDETLYNNFLGQVTGITEAGWSLNIAPQPIPVADYLELSGITPDAATMTQSVAFTQTDIPIYQAENGSWVQITENEIGVGDTVLLAVDGEGSFVWCVLIQKAPPTEEPTEPSQPDQPTEPEAPTEPSEPTEPSQPSEPTEPTNPSEPTQPTEPSQPVEPGNPGGNTTFPGGSFPSGGSTGGSVTMPQMGGNVEQTPAFELYGLDLARVATVTPQDTITLDITIDELEIRSLQVGMTAQVKIDALGGEKHTATITEIGNTGTSNGGNSKYTVELTMERSEQMLPGMTATASMVLSTVQEVLTIPAAALVEQGNDTMVYTSYDPETDTLSNPVAVEVGCSDGETVEILAGLSLGQTYYYGYYDTLEISVTHNFGGGSFPFG